MSRVLTVISQPPSVPLRWLNNEVKVVSTDAGQGLTILFAEAQNTNYFTFLSRFHASNQSPEPLSYLNLRKGPQSDLFPAFLQMPFNTSLLFAACKFLPVDKWHRCQKFKKNVYVCVCGGNKLKMNQVLFVNFPHSL